VARLAVVAHLAVAVRSVEVARLVVAALGANVTWRCGQLSPITTRLLKGV
jgi:hypothetical protein